MYLAIGGAAIFLAVALLAATLIGSAGRRTVDVLGDGRAPLGNANESFAQRITGSADRLLDRHDRRRGVAEALEVAGSNLRPGEFAVLTTLVVGVFGLIGLSAAGPVGLLLGALVAVVTSRAYLQHRAQRRRVAFAAQLPDVLQLMISALRSGYALPQALDAAATQSASPAREELQRVLLEVRIGRDPADALTAAADRMQSRDFSWVVSAIQINREIGGELAGVLDRVNETIRERQRLARQVQTLTAEGRLSAYILIAMPVVLAVFISVSNPSYFEPLSDAPGPFLVVVAVVLLLLGWIWMRRLIKVKL